MKDIEREVFVRRRTFLLNNLDIIRTGVLDHLVEKGLITGDQEDEITSKPTNREKMISFLKVVSGIPQLKAFRQVCEILDKTSNSFIADNLRECLQELSGSSERKTRHSTSEQKVIDDLPTPVTHFFERSDLCVKLEQKLLKDSLLVICAIRGAGKTQLSRHIAQKVKNRSEQGNPELALEGHCIEMYCKEMINMVNTLESVNQMLGLDHPQATARSASRKDRYSQVEKDGMKKRVSNLLQIFLKELVARPPSHGKHLLVLDDVSSETVSLIWDTLHDHPSWRDSVYIIINTNNSNLFRDKHEMIEGFTADETLAFFRQDFAICKETDQDILRLGDKLSSLPLGLVLAKEFIKRRRTSISVYLKMLESKSASSRLFQKEKEMFPNGEYGHGLMTALQMSIGYVEEYVSESAFEAYQLTGFLAHLPFPLDYLKFVLPGNEDSKEWELGDLIEALTDTSLATVDWNESGIRMLSTHKAVQAALKLRLSDEDMNQTLGRALVFLSSICNKDTRFTETFKLQIKIMPHVQQLLRELRLKGDFPQHIDLCMAEVRLLETIGYSSCITNQTEKGLAFLGKAKQKYVQYFLNNNTQLLNKQYCDLSQEELEQDVHSICTSIEEFCGQHIPDTFMKFVLQRIYNEHDIRTWLQKIPDELHDKLEFNGYSISADQYRTLLQHDAALSPDQIHKVLLIELFVTILHSYGRIKYFTNSERLTMDQINDLNSSLILALEMCKWVRRKHDIRLIHLSLSYDFALAYDILTESNAVEEDIIDLKAKYQDRLSRDEEHYQFGLLKKAKGEIYNRGRCLRQMLKCQRFLINIYINGLGMNYYHSPGSLHRRHSSSSTGAHGSTGGDARLLEEAILEGISIQDTLKGELEELMKDPIIESDTTGIAAINIELAKFILAVISAQEETGVVRESIYLDSNVKVEEAMNLLCKACDIKKNPESLVARNYWLSALQNMCNTCKKYKEPNHISKTREQTKRFRQEMSEQTTLYNDEVEEAQKLLEDLDDIT